MASDVVMVYAPFPADRQALPVLQPLYRRAKAAAFVGDLDPFALVQYVETRRSLLDPDGPPLIYGGIDDAWLAAVERSVKGSVRSARLRIPLSRSEMRLLSEVERAIDLESLVGPRASALLRSGHKLELEGATNPGIHRRSHALWAVGRVRSLLRRAANKA